MTEEQKTIHERALSAKVRYSKFEIEFVKILQDVERTKLHRAMDKPSVFKYAIDILGFTRAVAYMYIAVARKSVEVPELMTSGLSVFVTSRMVSTIHSQNASELILFAQTHSSRDLEIELGRRNPQYKPEKVKVLSAESVELTLKVSKDFLGKLSRVEALRAQKNLQKGVGRSIEESLDAYLRRFDPVQKAERANKRKDANREANVDLEESALKSSGELCARRVPMRVPLTAAQRHAVFARDQGRCTHIDYSGSRCGSDQWIQVHHILEVARGGANDPSNLTTLCSFHHDQIHQLQLFSEEQTG